MSAENPPELILPKYQSFLREIRNEDLKWSFQLVGGVIVTGKIVDFLWDDRGVPITLMVLRARPTTAPIEIPWGIIQTIKLAKS